MSRVTIAKVEERIASFAPPAIEEEVERQAAVAAILRETNNDTEALFILRATKEGDPWSGHMAFPGGHREPADLSLRATAERETLEEIGLDLGSEARFLGQIEPVRANPRGRNINMVVTPFVYALAGDPDLTPNYEVADILWGSLNDMFRRDSLTEGEFKVAGQMVRYPGYSVGEHVVWGLTLRMLDQFFGMLDPSWHDVYD